MPRAAKPKSAPQKRQVVQPQDDLPRNTYRLEDLGYDVPVTGNALRDQLAVEFICFRIAHPPAYGGLGKFGHFRRIVDLLWNNPALGSNKRFIWNPWSEKMLREACETDELCVAGCTSAGKCLKENVSILYSSGEAKPAGGVQVGDILMGDDFKPRTVLEVHRGHGPMFRITPATGDPWECNGDHTQVIVVRDEPYGEWWEGEITTEKLLERQQAGWFGKAHLLRKFPDGTQHLVPFTIERIADGPWVGFSLDGNKRHLLGDFTVTHNSDPFALWVAVNVAADPTHCLALIMSTTLSGAKKRIWKSFREYWEAVPDLPGKPLWSTNEILGLNYDGVAYGQSSGVTLMASEQSNEKSAMDKLIGIKAPRTGEPNDDFRALCARPEFSDLIPRFSEPELRELLPRLVNLSDDRIGKLILVVDEATGCAPSILNVVRSNLKPGNAGHFQVVWLGNPNSHFDTFGDASTPVDGWNSVTLDDEEWDTLTGGKVIRFNGEKNPRITQQDESFSWMLRAEDIDRMEKTYGRESLYYYRMVLGFWSPQGTEAGVYSEADMLQSGSLETTTWGLLPPQRMSALDPSFVNGGDRAACTFFSYGLDTRGVKVLERTEEITIKANIDSDVPVSYQLVRQWRDECRRRGVPPENACFDATGGGVTFGDVVKTQWSPRVHGITSAGRASSMPVGTERDHENKLVLCSDRYTNMATEIWYGAHPYLRSGQIKGVSKELAKELCARRNDSKSTGRTLKVECKREFKGRQGHSPDSSDSFLLGVHHAKLRHGFKPTEKSAEPDLADRTSSTNPASGKVSTWAAFVARSRRISHQNRIQR